MLGGGRLPPSLRSSGRHRPTALARSVAYLTVWGANTHLKKVVALTLSRADCALRLLGRSRSANRVPHAMPIMPLRLPTPSRKPRPFSGGLTRALDAAAAARAGWVTGVTGVTGGTVASANAHAEDGATLRGALGLRAPARGGVRLRYGACASRRAGATVASAGAHAGDGACASRRAEVASFALQLYQPIGVSLDSLRARRCVGRCRRRTLRSTRAARARRRLPSISSRATLSRPSRATGAVTAH